MLVVSDIDDVFLPKPTDLLVNLAESRQSLEALLGKINDMFQENTIIGSALGPALQAGYKLMVGPLGVLVDFSHHVAFYSLLLAERFWSFQLHVRAWAQAHSKTEKIPRSLARQRSRVLSQLS